jgi:hypothetical protein
VALTTILNHEMWRDELEIWLIARDSATLPDLFVNAGAQAHPALWYLLAWGLTRFTANPLALQLLNLICGACAAFVFLRWSPFTRVQRVLFCFGYFVLYEYTVISRAYALELLLLFAVLALFVRRRRVGIVEALLLAALANTHLYGLIAAAQIVLLAVLLEWPRKRARRLWAEPSAALPLLGALAGVALGLGQIVVQALAIGPDHLGAYVPGYDLDWLLAGFAALGRGLVPLQDPTTIHSWNSSVLDLLGGRLAAGAGALLGVALLALGAAATRRRPALLAVFLLGSASMLVVTLFIWYGYARHHGHFFVWLIACLWLATAGLESARTGGADRPGKKSGKPLSTLLTAVLWLHAAACGWAVIEDLRRPFSQARAVGERLRDPVFEGTLLLGSIDYAAQPIAAFVDRPIWYPEIGRFATFMDWSDRRRMVPVEQALQDALDLFEEHGRDVVLVLNYTPHVKPGQSLALGKDGELLYLEAFTGAIVPDENYHLYRLRTRRPAD